MDYLHENREHSSETKSTSARSIPIGIAKARTKRKSRQPTLKRVLIVNQHLICFFSLRLFFSLSLSRCILRYNSERCCRHCQNNFHSFRHTRLSAVVRASKRNYLDTITIDEHKAKARTACSSRTNWCARARAYARLKSHLHTSFRSENDQTRPDDSSCPDGSSPRLEQWNRAISQWNI